MSHQATTHVSGHSDKAGSSKNKKSVHAPNWCQITLATLCAIVILGLFYEFSQPHGQICRGESFISKYGKTQGLLIAQRLHLPIYRGTYLNPREERVSLIEALMTDTRRQQLFVLVHPGDRYDLRFGAHYSPVPSYISDCR